MFRWPAAVGVFVLVVGTLLVHDAGTAVAQAFSFCPSVPPGAPPAECVRRTGYQLFPRRYAAYHAVVVCVAVVAWGACRRYRTVIYETVRRSFADGE